MKTPNCPSYPDRVISVINITPLKTQHFTRSDTGAESKDNSKCGYCVGLLGGHMESILLFLGKNKDFLFGDLGKFIGSLLNTVTHLFTDVRFILKIKQEFIRSEIAEKVQKEISEIDALYEAI